MDAKTQISVVEQNDVNSATEPNVEQIWDAIEQLQNKLQELQSDFRVTVVRALDENQELKWASHYSQSNGGNPSLEDFLVELDN